MFSIEQIDGIEDLKMKHLNVSNYLTNDILPRTRTDLEENPDLIDNLLTLVGMNLARHISEREPISPGEVMLFGDDVIFYMLFYESEYALLYLTRPEYDFTTRELLENARDKVLENVFGEMPIEDEEVEESIGPIYSIVADITESDVETLQMLGKGLEKSDMPEHVIPRTTYRILEYDNGEIIFEMNRASIKLKFDQGIFVNKIKDWRFI